MFCAVCGREVKDNRCLGRFIFEENDLPNHLEDCRLDQVKKWEDEWKDSWRNITVEGFEKVEH